MEIEPTEVGFPVGKTAKCTEVRGLTGWIGISPPQTDHNTLRSLNKYVGALPKSPPTLMSLKFLFSSTDRLNRLASRMK